MFVETIYLKVTHYHANVISSEQLIFKHNAILQFVFIDIYMLFKYNN